MLREFEMTEAQAERIRSASKPVPAMYLSGGAPMFGTPQENANSAWVGVAAELGFVWDTARPCPGKGERVLLAQPVEETR